ncbi:MAG TPA: 4-hydroxy-tetrahydrodipicolinate synthase [Nocardioidaceae bacterium]|nr:4-hydroxy-tetrahydrodipicolinate synthase [Nocardioidaceae bacterium]
MSSSPLAPAPFGRVLTAMVTAFADDGSVDLDATARVAVHLADNGHDGVVVSGTTGEAPTTSVAENAQILRAVVDAVGDRVQVVAGVGTNNTAHSIELAEQAAKAGAHGALLVTPYYNKPTQEGVAAHFEAVANASDLPVMLYDIPGRTVTEITLDTYKRVAEHERIVAVKDAVGDLFRGVRIMEQTGLSLYSGDDEMNLGWLTHGGSGVVSVVGHVAGNEYAAMVRAVEVGDVGEAFAIYRKVAPLVDVIMTRAPGAMMAKAAMQLMGVLDNRNMRLPLVPASDDLVGSLRTELANAGLIDN